MEHVLAERPGSAEPTGGATPAAPASHRHKARWVLAGVGLVAAAAGTFISLWLDSGPHALPANVAIDRFRHQAGGGGTDGPPAGVYRYRGSGTESLSLPPKSQTEGPEVPGTVVHRNGCFVFRLDYSDAHWQSWTYCVRRGALESPARAGYYDWDFVAFHADDTSTFACDPPVATVPAGATAGRRALVSCTGHNDKLPTGPVAMRGTSTVVRTGDVRVGSLDVPAVLVAERVTLSGGQHGSNTSDTWYDVATGLPLRGNWHTKVSTPSSFGTSTLDGSGTYALESLTPTR